MTAAPTPTGGVSNGCGIESVIVPAAKTEALVHNCNAQRHKSTAVTYFPRNMKHIKQPFKQTTICVLWGFCSNVCVGTVVLLRFCCGNSVVTSCGKNMHEMMQLRMAPHCIRFAGKQLDALAPIFIKMVVIFCPVSVNCSAVIRLWRAYLFVG